MNLRVQYKNFPLLENSIKLPSPDVGRSDSARSAQAREVLLQGQEATMPEGAFYGQEGASWNQEGLGMRVDRAIAAFPNQRNCPRSISKIRTPSSDLFP